MAWKPWTRAQWLMVGLSLNLAPPDAGLRSEPAGVLSEPEAISFFLLNCAYFGQWPTPSDPQATRELRLGVLGRDTLGEALVRSATKATATWFKGGRVTIERADRPEDLPDAHVIFCGSTDDTEIRRLLAGFKGKPVILVGITAHFAENGGTLEVRIQKERLVFDLNLDQLREAGLELSSKMKKRAASFIRQGKKESNPFREGGGS
jgi:hypothetical protein